MSRPTPAASAGDRESNSDTARIKQLETSLAAFERRYQQEVDERHSRHSIWTPIGKFGVTILLAGGLAVMGAYQYLLTQQVRILTDRQEAFETQQAEFAREVAGLENEMDDYRALQPETLQAQIARVGAIADRRHDSLLELAAALQTFMVRETELLDATPDGAPAALDSNGSENDLRSPSTLIHSDPNTLDNFSDSRAPDSEASDSASSDSATPDSAAPDSATRTPEAGDAPASELTPTDPASSDRVPVSPTP